MTHDILEVRGTARWQRAVSGELRNTSHSQRELVARAERAPNSWGPNAQALKSAPKSSAITRALCMEIDVIVGRKSDSARPVVAVCQRTRYTLIGWLKHCTARAVEKWLRQRMREQHLPLVCLIPYHGSEAACLPKIKSLTVYPCQPQRHWLKPTVENTNGLIRNYIPKGQLISKLSPEFVAHIEHQLNHRPRLCLKWETPAELLSRLHTAVVPFH